MRRLAKNILSHIMYRLINPALRKCKSTLICKDVRVHEAATLFSLIFILLVFFGCSGHQKKKIALHGFNDRNEVVYETQKAKFIFSENSVIEYCNNRDTANRDNFMYRQVLKYLNNHQNKSIVIPDTLGTEMAPYNTVYLTSVDSNTLVRVRNEKKEYAFVPEAMNWILLDLIPSGKIKVYDKMTNMFVYNIFLDLIETKTSGKSEILLPNDSSIFIKLSWIK